MSLPFSGLDPRSDNMEWRDLRRYGLCGGLVLVFATAALATFGLKASSEAVGTTSDAVLVDLPPASPSSALREILPDGERQPAFEAFAEAEKAAVPPPPDALPPPPAAPHPAAVLDAPKDRTPDTPPPEPVNPSQEARAPDGSDAPVKDAVAITGEASEAPARHDYSQWQRAMVQRLEQAKQKAAISFKRTETVVVSFSIDHEGRLLTSAVARASNSPALDAAALALLKRAAPFPKAPAGVTDRDLTFTVPIVFKRR